MTPEERFDRIERQMEFLASHQAQLSTSVEALREVSARHEAEITAHTAQIDKLVDVVASLARITEEQGRRMEEQGRRMEEQSRRMEEQGRRTDERLNALINLVERHISNHRH